MLGPQIPWQEFETWWVFVDELGKSYRTNHALNDYADTRHRWIRTPTQYTVLYTYGQTAANISALAVAADHSIAALQIDFGYRLLYKPHLVLYNSPNDFKEWAPPAMEGGFIGMASGLWGGAVVAYYNSIRFTGYSIIKHELAHLYQFQSIQMDVPQWFVEGSARYFEEVPEEDNEAAVRKVVKQYTAPSLQVALPMLSPGGTITAWPYYVGMTFIRFMRLIYGKDSFARLHLSLSRGNDLGTALQKTTGKTFDQLDREWQNWIRK
jgi:hypothetical protein